MAGTDNYHQQHEPPVNYSRRNQHPTRIPRRPVNPAYEQADPLLSLSRKVTYPQDTWRSQTSAHGSLDQSPDSLNRNDTWSASQQRRPSILWWYLEILSLIAAVTCLSSIVAVLLMYDGKPLSSWPSSIITLNGLVALLSTLHRTFLMVSVSSVLSQAKWVELSSRRTDLGQNMRLGNFALFEYAAQGLGGCFQILWKFKGCHTACIGAFLTITSLVFGFFSQQLINTRVDVVASGVSGDVGDVLRATYQKGGSGPSQLPVIDLNTKRAILNGFLTNTTIDPPQVNCATGNCTWPTIPTLGVCGACVNLTDTIVMQEKNGSMAKAPCLATAKGGTQLDLCDYEFEIFHVSPGTGQVFEEGKASVERTSPLVIGELAAIRANTWGDENNRSAAECAFWYCVQARNVSVHNGVLRDTIMDTWTESGGEQITKFVNIPPQFNAVSDELYGMGFAWDNSLGKFWNETVTGNVTTTLRDVASRGFGNHFSDSIAAEGLMFNFGDYHAWATRFAESMTNALRTTKITTKPPPENQDPLTRETSQILQREEYRGTAFESQVTITVRWGWIAYPAVTLLLATMYLAMELVRSGRAKDIRPWRNDPLVTLFMTVDGELKNEIRPALEHPMGVSHVVGGRRIRVVRDDQGLPAGFHGKKE